MKPPLSRRVAYALFLILAPILAVVLSARFGASRVTEWSLLAAIGLGFLVLLQPARHARPHRVATTFDTERARHLPIALAIPVAKASRFDKRGVMFRARRKRVQRVLATISEKYTSGTFMPSPTEASEPRGPLRSSFTERTNERRQAERRRSERRRTPDNYPNVNAYASTPGAKRSSSSPPSTLGYSASV